MIKKLFKIAGIGLVIGVAAVAYIYFGIFEKKINTNDQDQIFFYVKSSDGFNEVVASLADQEIVSSEGKFGWLAELRSLDGNIYPGRYTLKNGMSWTDLVIHLRTGQIDEVTVTFNNVRTLEQLAKKMAAQIEASEQDLLKELTDPKKIEERGFQKETFLSIFIPNTYKFYWNATAKDFVDRMEKEYERFWNNERLAKAKKIGLTPVEVSTLASIVQSEQNLHSEEWKTIAGLYLNRLNKGIKLESDPTVIYAWGDFTIKRVLYKHLTIDNPYNTYKNFGLPPGPIRVPGSGVLDAVLNYEKHNYIFMCAKPGIGTKHAFAKNLREHNVNAQKWRAFMNKRKNN